MTPVARPFAGQDDFDRTVAFYAAVQAADGGSGMTDDDITVEWIDDEPGWVRTLQVWDDDGAILANFGVWHELEDAERAYSQFDIHPDARTDAFADEVVGAMVAACGALTGTDVELRVNAMATVPTCRGALERAGFTVERVFHRMMVRLYEPEPVAPLPSGFEIRPLSGEAEADRWVETYNRSFAGHHDAHDQSIEDKLNRMRLESYRPDIDLVLMDPAGEMVGVSQCFLESVGGEEQQAIVNQLGVVPEMRGKGLGRALLTASLDAFHRIGVREVVLNVDSANETGALALYESAGFEPVYQSMVYMRVVSPV